MKLLRKRIESHPIINPILCLIRCREPWVGAPPMPTVTHYISEVELGAACRYKFW